MGQRRGIDEVVRRDHVVLYEANGQRRWGAQAGQGFLTLLDSGRVRLLKQNGNDALYDLSIDQICNVQPAESGGPSDAALNVELGPDRRIVVFTGKQAFWTPFRVARTAIWAAHGHIAPLLVNSARVAWKNRNAEADARAAFDFWWSRLNSARAA
jgi:hypothetical protein